MSDSDDLHTCASRELLESIAKFHFPSPVPELLLPPSVGSHHTDQIGDVTEAWSSFKCVSTV